MTSIHEKDSPQNKPSVGVEKEVELERGPGETKEPRGKSSREQIQQSREFTKNQQRCQKKGNVASGQ